MTVNDWRWNADWFNHVGGLCQKNDVQFVYRNHGSSFGNWGRGSRSMSSCGGRNRVG